MMVYHVWHENTFLIFDFFVQIRVEQQLLEVGGHRTEDDRVAKDRSESRTQAAGFRGKNFQVAKLKCNEFDTT